jgi:uncharacterized protein YlxW (UPF0749 family)
MMRPELTSLEIAEQEREHWKKQCERMTEVNASYYKLHAEFAELQKFVKQLSREKRKRGEEVRGDEDDLHCSRRGAEAFSVGSNGS